MTQLTLPLAIDGVFWTVQGEGTLTGTPMVFVRLAGCSIGCPQCDTDYRVVERVTVDALIARVQQTVPAAFQRPWVWITGGEPTDHAGLPMLCDGLHSVGFNVALATAGTRALSQDSVQTVQWISVSPHSPAVVVQHGHEIKLVPGLGQLTWDNLTDVRTQGFAYKWIQPLAEDADGQARALEFVLAHPGWRLSIQAHKHWRIR